MTATRRAYAGPADLRRMQELVSRVWSVDANWHIGDLAWGRFMRPGREAEWQTELWEDGGEVVGWGWIYSPGYLRFACRPDRPKVAEEILAWFVGADPAAEPSTDILGEPEMAEVLERAGFREVPDPDGLVRLLHPLTDLREVGAPEGYTVRAMTGAPGDLTRRVEVHRSAFEPSKMTEESYAAVMAAWPYRIDLDRVVEAPDGRFAASCLVWYDEATGVGELEPVGTHQDFRRRGLAAAACLSALHALRGLGGRQAFVLSHDRPDNPASLALYRSVGFRDHARTRTYRLTR